MASKFYRSSRGQKVDISNLLLQQENTRAVGNMGVNARGDKIDSKNQIVKTRNEQMDNQYAKQVNKQSVVTDEKVFASKEEAQAYYKKQAELEAKKSKQQEMFEEPVEKAIERNVEKKVEEKPKPKRKYTRRKTTTTKKTTTTAKKTITTKKVETAKKEVGKNDELKKLLAQRIQQDVKEDKPIEVPVKQEIKQEEAVLEPAPEEIKVVEQPEPVQEEVKPVAKKPLSGLAAAMAKSREVKQEKEKTLRQQQQSTSGVKRI